MAILFLSSLVALWFVSTAVDIVVFFLGVRLLRLRFPAQWIVAIDSVGRPLVDGLLRIIANIAVKVERRSSRQLREGPKLVLCVVTLWIISLLVAWLRHAVLSVGGASDGVS